MRALALLAVLASCESRSAPPSSTQSTGSVAKPIAPVTARELPALPGTIWFVDDAKRMLSRIASGKRTDVTIADATLFPSRWSLPDGRLVAIASRGDGSPESEQLALVAADATVARLGPVAAMVRDPTVDPRGRWIVIAANLDGHSDLYRIDLETQQAARITNDPKGNFAPVALAADAIAFVSSRDDNSELYRMAAKGGKPQRLTAFHKDDWAPVASPDGATIVFSSDREGPVRLFVMAADGTLQRRLTTRGAEEGDELEVTWSRDGKRIAYIVEHKRERTLRLREVATGEERTLTPPNAHDFEPSFSPDGAWLAVSRDGALWAIEVATGASHQLTDASSRLPRWH